MAYNAFSRSALRQKKKDDYYGLCWLLAPACTVALSGTRRDLPR